MANKRRSPNGKVRDYATEARIMRGSTIVFETKAVCHKLDTPNRAKGTHIAGNRAIDGAKKKLEKAPNHLQTNVHRDVEKSLEVGDIVYGKANQLYGTVTAVRDKPIIGHPHYVEVIWFSVTGQPMIGSSSSINLKKVERIN